MSLKDKKIEWNGHEFYNHQEVVKAIKELKRRIITLSSFKVVEGHLPKQRIEDFREGEGVGREMKQKDDLRYIDEVFGDFSEEER